MSSQNPKEMNEAINAWAPLERAWREDPDFRDRLAADPSGALADKGMRLPSGIREVRVAENTADTFHVIFPGDPNASLSDEALMDVAGGTGHGMWESLPMGPRYESSH